ncbi:hypothetical protein AX17_006307 [Amanita inopinata Kibby_2008]|nr:hypothetical protein AX17_006307 [Amanita inopinata Kibby_2008]
MGGTTSHSLHNLTNIHIENEKHKLTPISVFHFRGRHVAVLGVLASLIFILSISFTFIGANVDELIFKNMLNDLARRSPGIVLFGENVDVDVDEPSITIRWSILSCGENQFLPGSAGIHGSDLCGLPSVPLHVFVDGSGKPAATYDPNEIPFDRDRGLRRSIQNLVQFDSDHVLDVHQARLYPFDTYMLSSTLRAVSFDNRALPIQKLATIVDTSSFSIETIDIESYSTSPDRMQEPSRDFDMYIRRSNDARCFALILFTVNWLLAHITVGHVLLAKRHQETGPILKHLLSAGAILIAIPQIRNSMPDAPGLDGVLIDAIGFFPQMVISGTSVIVLLLILIAREYDTVKQPTTVFANKSSFRLRRHHRHSRCTPPPPPNSQATSVEIGQYEVYRLMKHFDGRYVFPPLQPRHGAAITGELPIHQRRPTVSNIRDTRTMSRWSDDSV